MSPDRAIEQWADVIQRVSSNGLGYSRTTSIARVIDGNLASREDSYTSRPPRHAALPGLRGYLATERVLKSLEPHHRKALYVECIAPIIEVGRNQFERAESMGVSYGTYRGWLRKIRAALLEQS